MCIMPYSNFDLTFGNIFLQAYPIIISKLVCNSSISYLSSKSQHFTIISFSFSNINVYNSNILFAIIEKKI